MNNEKYIELVLDTFQHLTHKPENFLVFNTDLPEAIKTTLKEFYDFSKIQEKKLNNSKALSKLHIEGFDDEQIWQEVELQNAAILSKSLNIIPKLIVNKDKLVFSNLINPVNDQKEHEDKIVEDVADNTSEEKEEIEGVNSDEDVDSDNVEDNENNYSSKKPSVVDDDFFKLDEMENFLNTEDKKEQRGNFENATTRNEDSEEDEVSDSIDLFQEDSEGGENDESRMAKFKDYFKTKNPEVGNRTKRNKFLDELDNEDNQEIKSTLELRQERLHKKIEHIEETAISEKPWTLKGEISGENRPQNSLLEEILEFDLTSRPAPIITENTSFQLEDIIKQRIKDKAFDSVTRKAKPVLTPLELKKKLTLDQEKSKHSLAQIYEKEYLDQQAALDPTNVDKEEEEPALHREVKIMMRELFNKLDALSNFHFTPKPAIPELRIINNMSAITMEEVTPVISTDASLLAPEEIRNKSKGDILGDSEKSKNDKNRERRKKQLKQAKHRAIINKNLLSGGKKESKNDFKHKNTQKIKQTGVKSIKSSKAFFTQLQEQAQTHIYNKVQSSGKKKEKNKIDARKMKL